MRCSRHGPHQSTRPPPTSPLPDPPTPPPKVLLRGRPGGRRVPPLLPAHLLCARAGAAGQRARVHLVTAGRGQASAGWPARVCAAGALQSAAPLAPNPCRPGPCTVSKPRRASSQPPAETALKLPPTPQTRNARRTNRPEAFGQHPNAEISYLIADGRALLDGLAGLGPRGGSGGGGGGSGGGGGGGGTRREEVVAAVAADLLDLVGGVRSCLALAGALWFGGRHAPGPLRDKPGESMPHSHHEKRVRVLTPAHLQNPARVAACNHPNPHPPPTPPDPRAL